MSFFMQGNTIQAWQTYLLVFIYILHVTIMKMNHTIEVVFKRTAAEIMEVKELKNLATNDIHLFHNNMDSRNPSIEVLNTVHYRQEGDILIFDMTYTPKFEQIQGKGAFMDNQKN
jgi:hypothetical protein